MTKDLDIPFRMKLQYVMGELELLKCKNCENIVKSAVRKKMNKFCSKSCSNRYTNDDRIKSLNSRVDKQIENEEACTKSLPNVKKMLLKKSPRQSIKVFLSDNGIYKVIQSLKEKDESNSSMVYRLINDIDSIPICENNGCSEKVNFNNDHFNIYCSNFCGSGGLIGKDLSDFKVYSKITRTLTEKQPIHLLENIEKRGMVNVEGSYHLDHIKSVKQGFLEGILPYVMADISNLQMLPALENISKGAKIINEHIL